jgi:methyl-accepting chemotaxis protein
MPALFIEEEMKMEKKKKKPQHSGFESRRSRILYQITALVVIVLIASGLATFFLVRGSQDRLIEKSIDKVIDTESENLSDVIDFMIKTMVVSQAEQLNVQDEAAFFAAILREEITDLQSWAIEQYRSMVESGLFGMEYIILILPPSQYIREPFILAANDEELIYNWEVPEYMVEAIREGKSYLLLEDGVPELGLSGAQLVLFTSSPSPFKADYDITHISVIPMQEKIDSINAFYDSERKSTSLTLGLVVLFSVIVVMLITFFVLSYLIRRRITEPIDRLAAAAEEVMEGNLDVDIEVHEGDEFEILERAFKEMVESFRAFMAKAVGET